MTSASFVRDPIADELLTPQNAALVIIDFQPVQVASIVSMERRELIANVVAVAKAAKLYEIPVVLSTVNVATGLNSPTIHQLGDVLGNVTAIDRTSINAWEDEDFVTAVKATGRRKLVMVALWTEVCLAFPALDAMREGFEVYPVVDAVGGTSAIAHRTGLERILQAGARPITWIQFACELQRDWNREATKAGFAEIVFSSIHP
ncbi:isochorismatase family protein [Sphingopyxis terrae]|uniref:Nicotinamidase-related amidase n=1 Tax=Sphingopyxis terrae subsp. ummariensis TaxID=429001 RepID=A0A1Y6FV96_9SPHN|nr:isochorismatase family protein [Sphingopyxis terrae]PCF91304.1 hydrolase [Sphingopyxis terrae subsp. ummariensis]SMQ76473.1 Nicotinamidase-related amidase [Sphingopyxis terrae subsp. ummariensis]